MGLDEEQVHALIALADEEGTTLSALFRDIIASYMGEHAAAERAWLWALRRQFHQKTVITTGVDDLGDTRQYEVQNLRDEIAALRELVAEHLAHHNSAEHAFKPRQQSMPSILFESVQTDASPPPVAIDETVLVKNREPVAPVIEAPAYGSFQEIEDNKEYSVDEVSAYLGLSQTTVRKYVRDGKISAQKVNRAYVFLGKNIREYLLIFSQAKG